MYNGWSLVILGFLLLIGSVGSKPRRRHRFFYAVNLHSLANLAVFDQTFVEELKAIEASAAVHDKTRQLIDTYLEDFTEGNGIGQGERGSVELETITANPISAYRLIRRCHLMAPQIIKEARGSNGLKLSDAVTEFPLPRSNDVVDAIEGILNLQSSYRMNVTQFASGNVFGSVGRAKLRGVHCVEIGNRALEAEMYAAAYEWLQEARRLAPLDKTVSLKSILEEKINKTMELHDAAWHKEMNDDNSDSIRYLNIFLDPLKTRPNLDKNPKMADVLYMSGEDRFYPELRSVALCSGENLKTSQETIGQFCWLEFKIHPEYTIGPLKMEFLSRYPPIVQIHNAFSPAETDYLGAGSHVLRRSGYNVDGRQVTTSHRSSTTGAMSRRNELHFRRKVGRMVDLNVVGSKYTAEQTQITSYATGGYYFYHHDFDESPNLFTPLAGNRLMTFMAYLNTVEQGGYTVFPRTKTYAEPIRGSAIFWFNVFSDGSVDYALSHIACPVIKGRKRVATKWIRMYDQFLRKHCLLEPRERFQVPVNGKYLPVPEEVRKIWTQIERDYRPDGARWTDPGESKAEKLNRLRLAIPLRHT